jgi:hypothetical protein
MKIAIHIGLAVFQNGSFVQQPEKQRQKMIMRAF